MGCKNKKVGTNLNYFEHFPTLVVAFTGCISFSTFASLVNVPSGIIYNRIKYLCNNRKN